LISYQLPNNEDILKAIDFLGVDETFGFTMKVDVPAPMFSNDRKKAYFIKEIDYEMLNPNLIEEKKSISSSLNKLTD